MKEKRKQKKQRKKHVQKPTLMQAIAKERIEQLFKHAEEIVKKNPERARRYITLARKISMKAKVKIPSRLKRKYCKYCYSFLLPGFNCRVRNNKGIIVYYCLECKHFNKVGFRSKKR